MTTTTAPGTGQAPDTEGQVLVWRRPADLAAHPLNVRHDLGDLTGLVKTIRTVGVLQPFVIVPTPDGEKVLAGHRRLAAAVEAGTELVPCYVRPDLADDVAQVTAMLVENGQRRDLSVTEEAQGYQQLAAFELSATQIAKATGQKVGHIKSALAVAGSDVALAVTDRYDLTLDQAATLAEFADDTEAVKALTVTAKRDPRGWDHEVSRLRQDRADAQAAADLAAQLTEAGVTVLDRHDAEDSRGEPFQSGRRRGEPDHPRDPRHLPRSHRRRRKGLVRGGHRVLLHRPERQRAPGPVQGPGHRRGADERRAEVRAPRGRGQQPGLAGRRARPPRVHQDPRRPAHPAQGDPAVGDRGHRHLAQPAGPGRRGLPRHSVGHQARQPLAALVGPLSGCSSH